MNNNSSNHSSSDRFYFKQYVQFIERHALAVILLFGVITTVAGFYLHQLTLRTDFEDLLPENQPSVVAFRQIQKRVGGLGTLNVAIESDDIEASKRFAENLVRTLKSRMGHEIMSIDYTVAPIRKFYQRNGILYLSVSELRELDQALADSIRRAKLEANPFYLDLEEDQQTAPSSKRIEEIEAKMRQHTQALDKYPQGYYIGGNGRLLAIFLRPRPSALEISNAKVMLKKVQQLVNSLHPERYHPSITVNFTGSIKVTVEEYQSIVRDLLSTIILCVVLVSLVVWIYFRLFRVLLLLAITLAGGAIWSFGLASMAIGYVNAQTAFLGSVIVGTAINYGILLLARYLEERRSGIEPIDACAIALNTTIKPTLIAALATGISFGSLGIAHIRSFWQFGFIGGTGIILCWILSYTLLPTLLLLFERVPWLRLTASRQPRFQVRYPRWLARFPVRRPRMIITITGLLLVLSIIQLVVFLPHSLETNINNLRNRPSVRSENDILDERISKIMGKTLIPAIILTDSPDQARRVCAALEKLQKTHPAKPPVEWCQSINSFLPDQQEQKLKIIAQIRERLHRTPYDLLPHAVQRRLSEFKSKLQVNQPLTISNLPDEIRQRFREKSGREGTLVLVAPGKKLSLWNIKDLFLFTNTIREIHLNNGEVVRSSGDSVVFADILRIISQDAPRTTILAGVGVILLLAIIFRQLRPVIPISSALFSGVTLMAGIAAALGVKYNFFNFVALPTTFGIGVDYPINIYKRYQQDGPGSMEHALLRTGPAVVTASLTTIIGYGVLLISRSLTLVSFGKLAMLGEFTCLIAALLLLPAISVKTIEHGPPGHAEEDAEEDKVNGD